MCMGKALLFYSDDLDSSINVTLEIFKLVASWLRE